MPYIDWNIEVWGVLTVHWWTEWQWYRDWVAIEWEDTTTYTLLITDQWHEITCAVYIDWEIKVAEGIYIDFFKTEETPLEKEYLIKAYDKNFVFQNVIPMSIITNDITYSESLNWGQGELVLNLNLPIDTNYLDNIKYIKVFISSNNWLDNELLYTWYLSKYSRLFSNNKENIQANFLSLYSLLSSITYKDWEGQDEFTIEGIEPATMIKDIIDYFDDYYPWILTYTNESIIDYWDNINVECKNNTCLELIGKILDWLNYYLYVWADWVVNFKPKPTAITHYFTYEKDISALTIPQDFEQVVNAVRVQYWYIWWNHHWFTDRAVNQDSIDKYGRKEQTITNQNIYWNEAAEIYRDSILNKYAEGKKNISMTINNNYTIEHIHPWDTMKIRNLWLDISWLQIKSVNYSYEQAVLQLEYQTTLAEQIFTSNNG